MVQFVRDRRPDLTTAASAPSTGPLSPASPESGTAEDAAATSPVVAKVLEVVAEVTGYPTEMLELDLDLEADLGIDTVKQAETFAAVREAYGIPRDDNLELRDFPTIQHVIAWVEQHRPEAGEPEAPQPLSLIHISEPTRLC